MNSTQDESIWKSKSELRSSLRKLRAEQQDREYLGQQAWQRVAAMPQFPQARAFPLNMPPTRPSEHSVLLSENVHARAQEAWKCSKRILMFASVRDEIPTLDSIARTIDSGLAVAVPYCQDGTLQLTLLKDKCELEAGAYGILELRQQLRSDPLRRVGPQQIDFAIVPGLGFDRNGGRIGYGKGYYDRLLPQLPTDCPKVGLAYDCQLVENIPVESHDQRMDVIVTPTQTIDCVNQ